MSAMVPVVKSILEIVVSVWTGDALPVAINNTKQTLQLGGDNVAIWIRWMKTQ